MRNVNEFLLPNQKCKILNYPKDIDIFAYTLHDWEALLVRDMRWHMLYSYSCRMYHNIYWTKICNKNTASVNFYRTVIASDNTFIINSVKIFTHWRVTWCRSRTYINEMTLVVIIIITIIIMEIIIPLLSKISALMASPFSGNTLLISQSVYW